MAAGAYGTRGSDQCFVVSMGFFWFTHLLMCRQYHATGSGTPVVMCTMDYDIYPWWIACIFRELVSYEVALSKHGEAVAAAHPSLAQNTGGVCVYVIDCRQKQF